MTLDGSARRLYGEVDPRWRRRVQIVAAAAAWLVIAAGVAGLLGRLLNLPILAQWVGRPGVRPMQPVTAALFVTGGATVLTALLSSRRWLRWLGLVGAATVFATGIYIVIVNLVGGPFPMWLLSRIEVGDVIGGERPALPAVNEGLVLAAVGLSVLLLSTASRVAHIVGQLLSVLVLLTAALVVVAFAYGDDSLRGFPVGPGRMAISSALVVVVLSVAVLAARPHLGLMAPIISPWPGGIVLRRLLPFVLAGPPVAVALLLEGTTPASQPRWLAVTAVLVSGLLVAALFATAVAVSRSAHRLEIAEDLRERAVRAVGRDAEVVDLLLSQLSAQSAKVMGIDLAVRFRPAEGWLGGDAALAFGLDQGRLGVVLLDVAGHGAVPAVAAVRLGDVLRHSMRSGHGPAEALARSGWVVEELETMASVAVVEIDASTGSVRFALAGCPPILHLRNGQLVPYGATGPILIAERDGEWHEERARLEPNDALVLFSDGLADPTNPDAVAVATVDDLERALRSCPYTDAERMADWCLDEALAQAEGMSRDDISLIILRWDATPQPETSAKSSSVA